MMVEVIDYLLKKYNYTSDNLRVTKIKYIL